MMRYLGLVTAALVVMLATLPSAHAKPRDFAKQSITAKSTEGAVIFTSGTYPNRYEIWIARQDLATKKTSSWISLAVDPAKSVMVNSGNDALLIKKLKPGRYVVQALIIQSFFGGCLREKTLGFDVVAGKAFYLGRLLPQLSLFSIETRLRETGQAQTRGPIMRMTQGGLAAPLWTLDGALALQPLLDQAKTLKFTNDTPVETQSMFATDFSDGC